MTCETCGGPMVIAEWEGWVWACFSCDAHGRRATDEEINVQHNQIMVDSRCRVCEPDKE